MGFFGPRMWKFPGQGSTLCFSCDHCTTQEVLRLLILFSKDADLYWTSYFHSLVNGPLESQGSQEWLCQEERLVSGIVTRADEMVLKEGWSRWLILGLFHLQPHPLQCFGFNLQQAGPPSLHPALQHRRDPVPGSHRPLQPLLPHDAGGAYVFSAQHHLDRDWDAFGKVLMEVCGAMIPLQTFLLTSLWILRALTFSRCTSSRWWVQQRGGQGRVTVTSICSLNNSLLETLYVSGALSDTGKTQRIRQHPCLCDIYTQHRATDNKQV